jgi:Holliday junction resolvasome RuvABC ATP-dependent DNA helicase subunit
MGLKCKESTFEKLMYKFRSHHLPSAEKPELNDGCMKMRRELATLLLGMDLKNVVFIDEANARSEYGKEHLWHTLEEYYHLDIKQPTTKQAY